MGRRAAALIAAHGNPIAANPEYEYLRDSLLFDRKEEITMADEFPYFNLPPEQLVELEASQLQAAAIFAPASGLYASQPSLISNPTPVPGGSSINVTGPELEGLAEASYPLPIRREEFRLDVDGRNP